MVERYCVVTGDAFRDACGGCLKAFQRMRSRLSGDEKLNRTLRKVVLVLNEKG